jgi:hypothetical protein
MILIANKEKTTNNKIGELHHSEIGLLTVRDIIKGKWWQMK